MAKPTGSYIMNKQTRVVHFRNPFDVYIGRPGPWGNPFIIGKHGDRTEVIERYKAWFAAQPQAWKRKLLVELKGERLGCYCAPLPCHGDIIANYCDTHNSGTQI